MFEGRSAVDFAWRALDFRRVCATVGEDGLAQLSSSEGLHAEVGLATGVSSTDSLKVSSRFGWTLWGRAGASRFGLGDGNASPWAVSNIFECLWTGSV